MNALQDMIGSDRNSGDESGGRSALVLCRTPLQGRLVEEVLAEERVRRFDLLYLTHQNSPEDRRYFGRLSRVATRSDLIHVPPARFDVLNHLRLRARAGAFMRNLGRDLVILASIDNFVFSAIARKQTDSELVTFDDGVSNIVGSGIYVESRSVRRRIYRAVFGAYGLTETRAKIARHYTIFPQFENIVPADKLRFVNVVGGRRDVSSSGPVFFVGQPFHQVLTSDQISRLTSFLRNRHVDYYVRHPRELAPLDIDAPEIDKDGSIAEDAIFEACPGQRPTIIGLMSAVLFSISPEDAAKIMLVFEEERDASEFARLGVKAGCALWVVP